MFELLVVVDSDVFLSAQRFLIANLLDSLFASLLFLVLLEVVDV